jgi:Flp pilus assembly protein TadD
MRGEEGALLDPRVIAVLGEVDRTHALDAIDESLAQSPEDVSLWLARGTIHGREGDWDAAAADYSRAQEIDPEDPRVLNNLAWLLLEQAPPRQRNHDKAAALARRATEVAPDDPYAAGTYATALLRGGDAAGAIPYFERALAVKRPAADEATDRFLLAIALSRAGRPAEARSALREGTRLDGANAYRSEAEAALDGSSHSAPAP